MAKGGIKYYGGKLRLDKPTTPKPEGAPPPLKFKEDVRLDGFNSWFLGVLDAFKK